MCKSTSKRTKAQNDFSRQLPLTDEAGQWLIIEEKIKHYKAQFNGFTNCPRLPFRKFVETAAAKNGMSVEYAQTAHAKAKNRPNDIFRFVKKE